MTIEAFRYCTFTLTAVLLLVFRVSAVQPFVNDTITGSEAARLRYDSFYDSLKVRAGQKKLTRLLHNLIIRNPKTEKKTTDSLSHYSGYTGKIIRTIRIIRLDVFGPTLKDTARKASIWYEKTGNFLHTRSDLHNIRKNLIVHKGDILKSGDLYENERLLRAFPYIKDARFFAAPDTIDPGYVNLTLVVQDRFSLGVSGGVNSSRSADVELYNHNIFGVGHELSARLVGHLRREPYMGIESFYKINNISGKFITYSAGYLNTFENEGAEMNLNKEFLRVSDKWGYGASGFLMKRTYHLPNEKVPLNPDLIGYVQYGGWCGRNFRAGREELNSRITLSGQFIHRHFTLRPPPLPSGDQLYRNTDFFLAGITWSQRIFKTDEMMYSYGITEDIPKGYRYELVAGYDKSDSGDRLYSHIHLANANLLRSSPAHLFFSGGFSSYLKNGRIEQGLAEFSSTYISPLMPFGKASIRQFFRVNYKYGINRVENEKLYFEDNNLIRGFKSDEVWGKQRLSLNSEMVYFLKKDFYRFNVAFFTFVDLGVIAGENNWITKGKPYSGLGIGMRVHNESLMLQTMQIRLSFYPNHPGDVGLVGFLLNEQLRQRLFSFQPVPPSPRKYE